MCTCVCVCVCTCMCVCLSHFIINLETDSKVSSNFPAHFLSHFGVVYMTLCSQFISFHIHSRLKLREVTIDLKCSGDVCACYTLLYLWLYIHN